MRGYSILRRQNLHPPSEYRVLTHLPEDLDNYGGVCAFDLETHGTDPQTGQVRSVAISNDYGTVAIDLQKLSKSDRIRLTNWLLDQKLIAHNAVFDAAWLYSKTGTMPNMEACTLVLLKLLATEGYMGQQWGLKTAMKSVLGWRESNETDLHDWLKANKLKTEDMAQAPWEILGKYNALDTTATWQLYKYLKQVISENGWSQSILEFHRNDFINLVYLTIEQQEAGMTIDLDALAEVDSFLAESIEEKRAAFLNHPEVAEHVKYYQSVLIDEIKKIEPPKLTKTGQVTARYIKWQHRLEAAKGRIDFNIDSPQQLQWLFYERLFYDCPILTDKGAKSVGKKAFPYFGELGKLLKEYRKLRDRRKFVSSLKNVQRGGVFHPRLKIHGCVTGRSSGGT